ncbi:hypothetical protein [Dokdonella sp.]|uniref:hypothetical protein n=1 Tax=Dokdonella sp. TaxID=2291710 RepID=UPI00262C1267|nr:hypothetical protein [Dokdonella sp.]
MKRFPLEPLTRVRDLRLEAQQKRVTECRAEVAQAEQLREQARQARSDTGDRRSAHQRACESALDDPLRLAPGWLERAERHREWLDNEIVRGDAAVAAADRQVAQAEARLREEIAKLRAAQAKVDALENFRDEWTRKRQSEQERREEQDGEELFRLPAHAMR